MRLEPRRGLKGVQHDSGGWPDLRVLGREADVLLHNQAGSGFRDVTAVAVVSNDYASKTASCADYDNDGWVDLVVGSGEALTLNFGLGDSRPQTVTVDWPDGMQQTFSRLSPDRAYQIDYTGGVTPISPSGNIFQNPRDRLGL